MVGYYRRWVAKAFQGVWGLRAAFSTVVTFLVPLAASLWPNVAVAVASLAWQIPLGICAVFALARIVVAPYWLWCDDRAEAIRVRRGDLAAIADRDERLAAQQQLAPRMTVVGLDEVETWFMFLIHFENPGERISVRNDWRLTITRFGTVIADDMRGVFNTMADHILEAGAPSDMHVRFRYDRTVPDKDHLASAVFTLVGSDFRNRPLRATFPPQAKGTAS